MTDRTVVDHFRDWESHVFGYGYGTGEPYILGALRTFLDLCRRLSGAGYDYAQLELALTPAVAWLLINVLSHAGLIDYGVSARYGWLTIVGVALRDFVTAHTVEELCEMIDSPEGKFPCAPDLCNCGPDGYSAVKLCHNPFWRERRP